MADLTVSKLRDMLATMPGDMRVVVRTINAFEVANDRSTGPREGEMVDMNPADEMLFFIGD